MTISKGKRKNTRVYYNKEDVLIFNLYEKYSNRTKGNSKVVMKKDFLVLLNDREVWHYVEFMKFYVCNPPEKDRNIKTGMCYIIIIMFLSIITL